MTLTLPREDGVVLVVELSEEGLGKITENKMGEAIIASPIFVNNALIIRGESHLWCLR